MVVEEKLAENVLIGIVSPSPFLSRAMAFYKFWLPSLISGFSLSSILTATRAQPMLRTGKKSKQHRKCTQVTLHLPKR